MPCDPVVSFYGDEEHLVCARPEGDGGHVVIVGLEPGRRW
jgi:hypothetical protein